MASKLKKRRLPDTETQKREMTEHMKKPLRKGDSWYLVDCQWFRQWKKFVGFDTGNQFGVGDLLNNPGPIDNSSLFQGDGFTLKENLIDELHYNLLPEEAWFKLVSWYGMISDQQALQRKVVVHGTYAKFCRVEVYLMEFQLSQHSDPQTLVTRHFSRGDTIGHLMSEMKRAFSISKDSETQLWTKDGHNSHQLLAINYTVAEAGLCQGEVLVIEEKSRSIKPRKQDKIKHDNMANGREQSAQTEENPGLGTSDGTFENKRLDKLTPQNVSNSESSKKGESCQSHMASRAKETVLPSFWKEKNEETCSQGDTEQLFKIGQRVVTSKNNCQLRGCVRFMGKDRDGKGKSWPIVGLELDTRDGLGTGKLHGRQVFVCKTNFALFVPIENVLPEEDFDENLENAGSRKTSERVKNVANQIRKFEHLAKSSSFGASSSGVVSSKRVRRARSVDLAGVIKAAGGSGKTDPTEFIEQQQRLLDEIKSLKTGATSAAAHMYTSCPSGNAFPRKDVRGKDEQKDNLQRQSKEIDLQLRAKDERIEYLERRLRETEVQLTNFQVQLAEKDLREASLREQLREKVQQQENSQRQLTEMEQRLTNCQEDLQKRDLREASLRKQLRVKEQQEEYSQRQVAGMGHQLTNCERQIRERDEERANIQQRVSTLERQLGVKEQELNELELSLTAARQTLSQQRRQETCDWVISRNQIQVTDKCLGKGGWGSVYEGTYCGCSVAVKQIHEEILSSHSRRLFEREMNIASRCRHPCLLQFIGATNDEGSPLFVTELMETSLRALLEQRELSETEITVISLDVAGALNYLHQKRPSPIIHRDVSSANVLLWRQGDQWRGKVSDYGTANFVQQTMTVAPGNPFYSAPEALSSRQTAMVDVYSFGVLLCEMCIGESPVPERREEQLLLVTNRVFRGLVRRCLQTDPAERLNMEEIIEELEQ